MLDKKGHPIPTWPKDKLYKFKPEHVREMLARLLWQDAPLRFIYRFWLYLFGTMLDLIPGRKITCGGMWLFNRKCAFCGRNFTFGWAYSKRLVCRNCLDKIEDYLNEKGE